MGRAVPMPRPATRPRTIEFLAGGTANATFTLQDCILGADTTAGTVTHTLPAASSVPAGTEFESVWLKPGVNNLLVAPTGGDFVNGLNATYDFTVEGTTAVRFASNGVDSWWLLTNAGGGADAVQALANCPRLLVTGGLSAAPEAGNAIVVSLATQSLDGALQAIEQPYAVELVSMNGEPLATADWTVTVGPGGTAITNSGQARVNFKTANSGQVTLAVADVSTVFAGTILLRATPMYDPSQPISTPGFPTYILLTFA